jgi:tetratricopeptide (TPR) repeat protein
MLGEKLLREFGPIAFGATMTAKFSVPVENLEAAKQSLSVEIESSDSRLLLHWSAADPIDGKKDFVPAAGVHEAALKPLEKMTVEEIYLRGVEQEKSGAAEAAANTYEQVLQRDPMYIPALLKLAMRDTAAANLGEAEAKIALAEKRNKTDPAVWYAAGLVYRKEGDLTRAQDAFWSSLQFGGTPAPALAQSGEIAIQQKNYDKAAGLLRRSLSYSPEDTLVLTDFAAALRLDKKYKEASAAANEAFSKMPLLPFALAEAWMTGDASGSLQSSTTNGFQMASPHDTWKKTLAQDIQYYLEVAAWYRDLGDLPSSDAILQAGVAELPAKDLSPMVYYYLAANAWQEGKQGDATKFAAKADSAPHGKIFPQRLADAFVLQDALAHNPKDAHAHYFLGTFLFAHGRYEDAAKEWLAAKGEGFEDPVLERDLGVYAWRVKKDLAQAATYYESAIQLAPNNHRLYSDLDEIYTQLGDYSRREKLFATAPSGVQERDTFRARRALFLVEQRRFDQAMELFNNHHFNPWEGGQIIREIFVLANIERGRAALEAKKYAEAKRAFRQALEYPVKLGVGKPDKPHDEEAWYWLGTALAAEGEASSAREAWQTVVKEGNAAGGVSGVFAAGAMIRLGQVAEGEKLLAAACAAANQPDASGRSLYVAGLAENLRNHEHEAQTDYRRAVELDPLLWEARFELNRSTTAHE